jgi:hypothetical protein
MTGDPSLLLIKVLKCGKEEENKKCSNTNIKKNKKKPREKRDRGRLCVWPFVVIYTKRNQSEP